jgi:hypothetical protein
MEQAGEMTRASNLLHFGISDRSGETSLFVSHVEGFHADLADIACNLSPIG